VFRRFSGSFLPDVIELNIDRYLKLSFLHVISKCRLFQIVLLNVESFGKFNLDNLVFFDICHCYI